MRESLFPLNYIFVCVNCVVVSTLIPADSSIQMQAVNVLAVPVPVTKMELPQSTRRSTAFRDISNQVGVPDADAGKGHRKKVVF